MMTTQNTRQFGRCTECKTRFVASTQCERDDADLAQCSASLGGVNTTRHMIRWGSVKATVTGTQCSSKCSESKSPICKCACGGENHGAYA